VRTFRTFGVNQHDHFASEETEANQSLLAVVLPLVFACDGEMIPNRIATLEIKSVVFDVEFSLGFVPSELT
jgi:hypothetical protein